MNIIYNNNIKTNKMNYASFFIKDKGLFGSYPNQERVIELEENGVIYFVNLTFENEKNILPYKTNNNVISYPIRDRSYPDNLVEFTKLIINLKKIIEGLKNNEKIYLHCRGGHGRVGILVSVLLFYMFNLNVKDALELTNKYHGERLIMKEKWRIIGSPQTYNQKKFVYNYCSPIFFNKSTIIGKTAGFSNCSPFKVNIPNVGIFPTAEAAYQSYKSDDPTYIKKLKNFPKPQISKKLGNQIPIDEKWLQEAPLILYKILKYKFEQNPSLITGLLNTGLSDIVFHTKYDLFLGNGHGHNDGQNILGKTLVKLRTHFYEQI